MAADDQLAEWEAEWQTMAPEMRVWVQRLWGESPRGVILIVGAYGDDAVERLLRAACLDVKQVDDLLDSGGSAPLGSFGAKIKACWCLGFLPEDEYVNLEQIRKMRNEAAHNWTQSASRAKKSSSTSRIYASPRFHTTMIQSHGSRMSLVRWEAG
jgi:hypothetical protein